MSASFDGAWQKRGTGHNYNSLSGIVVDKKKLNMHDLMQDGIISQILFSSLMIFILIFLNIKINIKIL